LPAEPCNSVTLWVEQLRAGNSQAAQQLWEAYYRRLVELARKQLAGRRRLVGDEEDVALSAFKSLCRGLEQGRFPDIADRDDLWNLLVTLTLHKVLHLVRDERRLKRGGAWSFIEAAGSDGEILNQLVCREPAPEMAVQLTEEMERLLGQLPNAELVELALLKMEGFTNAEISVRWQKTERTVERKLNLIRQIWQKAIHLA
jgi:DNA-directed RNA polymerase specialized sigma24 family protein